LTGSRNYVILIDVGGTFLKGTTASGSFSQRPEIIRRMGPTLTLSKDGAAILDPRQLHRDLVVLCRELAESEQGKLDGIFITGQMHGLVLVDSGGDPVTEVITWRDSLSYKLDGKEISSVAVIANILGPERLVTLGNELREGIPVATLLARRSRGQQVVNCVPHSLISFCAASLTGFSGQSIMHSTDAAAHGFLSVADGCWDLEVLNALGLGGMILPEVTDELVSYGNSTEFKCPVYVAVGDQQAALFGMNLQQDELSLNIATGSQVSALVAEPVFVAQLRPYFHGQFLSTITHIPAGRALNALVDLVTELSSLTSDEAWQLISIRTAQEEGTRLGIDLSFFPSATGSTGYITNITEGDLRVGQLFRSAVQAMADQYRHFATKICPNDEFASVVISGGLATRFTPLLDAIRSSFGHQSYRVSSTEDASLEGLWQLSSRLLH
jgi:sugar (pentulose or hexulose) kinase